MKQKQLKKKHLETSQSREKTNVSIAFMQDVMIFAALMLEEDYLCCFVPVTESTVEGLQ